VGDEEDLGERAEREYRTRGVRVRSENEGERVRSENEG
jgi:hypothetical protein